MKKPEALRMWCLLLGCVTMLGAASAVGQEVAPDDAAAAGHGHHRAPEDSRKPLRLLPMMAEHQKQNMREHLVAVRDIVNALSASDFAAVEKFAAALGTTPEMERTCNVMGAATPGFSEQALAFHRTADGIGEAARRGEHAEVMTALGKTLETCTACHATYRQEVVDQETWKKLTKGQGG